MNIYEIDRQIRELIENAEVDETTGELLLDTDALDALQMERDTKVENLACYIKNLKADAEALRNEEKALRTRREVTEHKAERLKAYLSGVLDGEKFSSARAAVTWRTSEATEIDDDVFFQSDANKDLGLISYTPAYSRLAVKEAIKEGLPVEGAQLVSRRNMTIR